MEPTGPQLHGMQPQMPQMTGAPLTEHEPLAPSHKGPGKPRMRSKLSLVSVLLGCLVPTLMFLWVYFLLSSQFRYQHFWTAMICGPIFASIIALVCLFVAHTRWRKRQECVGHWAFAISMLAAVVFGTYLSDANYFQNMWQYYSYEDLVTYVNIDPSIDRGQSYMDSGQVYFKESTYVARDKAIAFQNDGIYCAAPIVRQPLENQGGAQAVAQSGNFVLPASETIDFWAVGQNCCAPDGTNFKCGQVATTLSRSGLRMLRDDLRPFFVLAVQEWASKYGLPVRHPLFFHWVQDPLAETDNYAFTGLRNMFMETFLFFSGNACATVLMHMALLRSGFY